MASLLGLTLSGTEYLCAAEPSTANDPKDPDHTVFWLTVADEFADRFLQGSRVQRLGLKAVVAFARGSSKLRRKTP